MPIDHNSDRPLTVPILAGGAFWHPAAIVPPCISVMLAYYLTIFIGDLDLTGLLPLLLVAGVGAVGPLISSIVILVRWSQRRWLEVSLSGFAVLTVSGRQAVDDSEVSGLKQSCQSRSSSTLVGVELDLTDGQRLVFAYEHTNANGDPLAGLWRRLARALAHRAFERLDQAEALVGESWEVQYGKLHLWEPEGETTLDLRSGVEVSVGEEAAYFWPREEGGPELCLPLNGRNLPVLIRLVRELQKRTPPLPEDSEPDDRLRRG